MAESDFEEGEIEIEMECSNVAEHVKLPIFEVVFSKTENYQKYGDHVLTILKQHWNATIAGNDLEISTPEESNHEVEGKVEAAIRLQAFEKPINVEVKESNHTAGEEDLNSDQNSNDSDYGVDLNNLFKIDPSPSTSLESAKVPSYKRAMKEFLDEESKPKCKKIDEDACVRPKPSTTCFNCGEAGHSLRDCPEPRNMKRINSAKKAHSSKGGRYHVDCDQRFAHLRPGVLSEKLQKALRLRRGELPSFFYRMRVCGYPPGWLEDAKVAHSGLAMFNSGDDVLKSEENNSETDADTKYDISKIIEYPGFNISPGSSFYDDYKYHNVPPMHQRFLKTEMITALGNSAIKGFKLKKLKDSTTSLAIEPDSKPANIADNEEHDMEIDDVEFDTASNGNVEFSRPLPPPLPPALDDNECPPLPAERKTPSPPNCSTPAVVSTNSERTTSPTLDELQAAQRALLLKLESGDDSQTDETLPTEVNDSSSNIIPLESVTPEMPETPTTPLPPDIEQKRIIKSSHMGTPVLKFSPFEKLPSGENFKVGVSDVINFENLPDSTGKYEAMKDVIKKVRTIKKRLNSEDE